MFQEKEKRQEIRQEIGNRFLKEEKGKLSKIFSKLKEKGKEIAKLFMMASAFTVSVEALAKEIKPLKDVPLITTTTVLANLIESGVSMKNEEGYDTFVFNNHYVRRDPENPVLGGDYLKIRLEERDGVGTDSVKITEPRPGTFRLECFNSDGSRDELFTSQGKVDSLVTYDEKGEAIGHFSSEDLENMSRGK